MNPPSDYGAMPPERSLFFRKQCVLCDPPWKIANWWVCWSCVCEYENFPKCFDAFLLLSILPGRAHIFTSFNRFVQDSKNLL